LSDIPGYYSSVYDTVVKIVELITDPLLDSLPEATHQQIDQYLFNLGANGINGLIQNISITSDMKPSNLSLVLGVVIMPVFLFYMLKDWEKLESGLFELIPQVTIKHIREILKIIDNVLGRFIRAQLVLGLTVGILIFAGLMVLQIPFALLLAILALFGEMIPTFGSWFAGGIAVFVALATKPDKALLVLILYGGVQLLENLFLTPRIHGGFLKIHPAVSIVLLILGSYFAGFWGVLLILPLTATFKSVIKYIRLSIFEERSKWIPY